MVAPSWPGPRRIAHRGGGTLAPENTLAAIRAGIAHGYRGVEFDVMLTADGVPVLMHDPEFGRTIAGHGAVAETTWADLATRDAGGWFGRAHAGEPVPRYEDVVLFCRAQGVWMNVELKPAPGFEVETGQVVAAATARLFGDRDLRPDWPLFSSFSVEALTAARSVVPHVPRGVLFDALPRDAVAIARSVGCASIHAAQRGLDPATIDALHGEGYAVLAYTVNDPARADALAKAGVDAVVTDRIDLIAPD